MIVFGLALQALSVESLRVHPRPTGFYGLALMFGFSLRRGDAALRHSVAARSECRGHLRSSLAVRQLLRSAAGTPADAKPARVSMSPALPVGREFALNSRKLSSRKGIILLVLARFDRLGAHGEPVAPRQSPAANRCH